MKTKLKTRAQWARHINALHNAAKATVVECAQSFIKLGRALLRAKASLPHGEFGTMIERDFRFTPSTAQRLMKIASNQKITKAAHAQHLPASWATLYELSKLHGEAFDQGISSGLIHSGMTREAAKRYITITTVSRPQKIVAPTISVNKSEPLPPPEPLHIVDSGREEFERPRSLNPALALVPQIEHLVFQLQEAVRRGEVEITGVIEMRLISLSEKLLALKPTTETERPKPTLVQ